MSATDKIRIYAETRRSAIEAFINTFPNLPTVVDQPDPGHFVDLDTQWHTHHVGGDGQVGRWRRMLTPAQIAIVNERLARSMTLFGYRP
jgi:hypothetical protein